MSDLESETTAIVDNREYYDRFSENYETRRHHGYHLFIDELQSGLVIPHARDHAVLEVGCGTGLILERVAPLAQRAVGIDLSDGMLEHSRRKGLDVVQASATDLPFEDRSFDVAYSFKVLSHVPELSVALSEMSRVIRPGGRVFAELYNRTSIRYLLRRIRGGHTVADGLHDNQVFVKFYSLREMLNNLPADLTLERIHGVRLFTTVPSMVSWPLIGGVLRSMERYAMSSWLARFGGFLVLECKKDD